MNYLLTFLFLICFTGEVASQCSGQFQCRTVSGCIPSNQYCDFKEDCADGSDEVDCRKKRLTYLLTEHKLAGKMTI
ncbi:hypothetical protein BSL78_02765 [Apostichopus japonicus]|uniref:Uncharacterized protein n=1 Tax=Stichopus japonicus TaxID=307972 RepID=A0A2G8LJ47_STIJA|nr:hypothetical protein BSL78_02765 [Apostichopus japonicus]